MSIITVSRGSYNRGKEVAENLAEELGYECISRDILLQASDQFNIPEIKLIKALHDAPSVLERFSNGKERYIAYFKSAFLSQVAKGNIIYHGLAGHFFLQNTPGILKVKINASFTDRVLDEMNRENCSQYTAYSNLKRDDEERRKWSMQLYGIDTWDAKLYDIVCCVDTLKVADIVKLLAKLVKKPQFQETEETKKEISLMAEIAAIKAYVFDLNPHAQVEFISKKNVRILGVKADNKTRKKLEEKLGEEFGIEEIHFKKSSRVESGHINNFHNIG